MFQRTGVSREAWRKRCEQQVPQRNETSAADVTCFKNTLIVESEHADMTENHSFTIHSIVTVSDVHLAELQ